VQVWAAALLLLFGVISGAVAASPTGPATSHGIDPNREFTILRIEPDISREEVRLVFSHPLPREVLAAHLRFLPRLAVNWQGSTVSPEGVLTLKGNFRFGRTYQVNLPEDLQVAGRTYKKTVHRFFLPDRLARLEYVEHQNVIERDSRQLLHVRGENVGPLLVEALTVPPLLLPQVLAAEREGAAPAQLQELLTMALQELRPLLREVRSLEGFTAAPLLEKQLFGVSLEKNRMTAISLPLTFRALKTRGGLAFIRVQDERPGSGARTPSRLFSLTDLGLTYKAGSQSLLVWASSLAAGQPTPGVQVAAITRDLEVFPLGETGQDGTLEFGGRELAGLALKQLGGFAPVKRRVAAEEVRFLLAGKGEDVTFLAVKAQGAMQPARVWQVPAEAAVRPLRGQVFTERGVYQPGERVFFKGVVRQWRDGRIFSPVGDRCSFEVVSSRGEKILSSEARLSEFGTAAGELTLPGHSPLGTYTLIMRFGADLSQAAGTAPDPDRETEETDETQGEQRPREEARTTFEVQEFKPPRHYVELNFQRLSRPDPGYVNRERRGEFVRIGITGGYYAGGPVKNGQVRWKISRTKTHFQVPGFEDFTFGYDEGKREELIEAGQALLDEQGRGEILFPLDQPVLTGRHGLLVVATVLDFDGRAASQSQTFQVEPEILVGISRLPDSLRVGESQTVRIVVVKQGKALKTGAIQAEVLQEGWTYLAKRNDQGDLYWDEQPVWRRAFASTLSLEKGEARFAGDFSRGGPHLLSFTYRDAAGLSFAAAASLTVEWGYDEAGRRRRHSSYQPLELSADRAAYEPGQTARLTVSAKRPVTHYLVTVERQGILARQVVAAKGSSQDLEIPIRADYAPNVFVSVLGLSPRGDFPVYAGRYDAEAPGLVWRTLNLPVRLEVEGLAVKIAPDKPELRAEPGARVTLDFQVAGKDGRGVEAELAVAVVDEAVLALTGFKTPTLDALLRFDLPLRVATGDLRALLLHQTPFYLAKSEALTGGGGLQEDLVAKLRQRFRAVAYFNPALRTDSRGRAQAVFTLPDNLTAFRTYVVALDRGSRFASTQRPLVVSKDFYLEPGMPGFFTQGDTFRFQVNAVNGTPQVGPLKFSATADGGLFLKAGEAAATLPAKDSLKVSVSGEAAQAGPAAVRFAGEFLGRADAVELPVRVNSGLVRETEVLLGSFIGSEELSLTLPPLLTQGAANAAPGEMQAVLTFTGSPFVRLSRAIRYLLTYPYGCVEQTASGVLGLAALKDVVQKGLVEGVNAQELDAYLKGGLSRILSLQTQTGGFAYWPGGRETHPWGTLYAAAALGLAKAKGLPVPETGLHRTVDYLKYRIKDERTPPPYKAFTAYVLALAGALDRATFTQAAKEEPRLHREGKILLILAARQANLKTPKDLKAALKPLLTLREEKPAWADEFQARFRGPALALLAGQLLLPGDQEVKEAALYLLGGLDRQGLWTSTSDTGWALLALGEYYRGASFSREPGTLTVSQPGGGVQQVTVEPAGFRRVSLDPALLLRAPKVQLTGPPGRTWLYKLELTTPRPDIAKTGEAKGFGVQKTIANTDGSQEIKVGDLVKVTVSLEAAHRSQRYVVLDDPLPAGLVAINTAFKTEESVSHRPGDAEEGEEDPFDYFGPGGILRYRPNFFEIRGDRVLAFRDEVWSGPQVFEYYARAVCEGTFVIPATKVAAMYSPQVHGYSPQGRLTIKGR
jgi:hypothetical protein